MMGPKWKARITMAILLIVLLAFVLTSFGCRNRKTREIPWDEINAERPNTASIQQEVSLR
ncbi:MAG: hypothetical protein HY549_09775 [Elusimicrobia bacterium]|nr:hypothetical protein [Elusimicrobiota bacterium]